MYAGTVQQWVYDKEVQGKTAQEVLKTKAGEFSPLYLK